VAAEQIARNLAFVSWTVVLVGSAAAGASAIVAAGLRFGAGLLVWRR